MLDQFDRLRKRNAFLEQYKKEKMFANGLEEFDEARYALTLAVTMRS
jgi:tubulin gamma